MGKKSLDVGKVYYASEIVRRIGPSKNYTQSSKYIYAALTAIEEMQRESFMEGSVSSYTLNGALRIVETPMREPRMGEKRIPMKREIVFFPNTKMKMLNRALAKEDRQKANEAYIDDLERMLTPPYEPLFFEGSEMADNMKSRINVDEKPGKQWKKKKKKRARRKKFAKGKRKIL